MRLVRCYSMGAGRAFTSARPRLQMLVIVADVAGCTSSRTFLVAPRVESHTAKRQAQAVTLPW